VSVVGVPIAFVGTGERLDDLEAFHADRLVSRILGMGDVLSLIEKAEQEVTQDDAAELERKIRTAEFTLEDFLKQMKQVRKMGPLSNVLGMMPGMGKAMKQVRQTNVDEGELDRLEAIILSMTPAERAHPEIIKGSRRKRIAQGSGTTIQAVNQLTKQFGQMQKLMKQLAEGKMPSPERLMRGR
ncbi:MAG: signal recognition particle protein, partial [Solirubrobacterales bacterium]